MVIFVTFADWVATLIFFATLHVPGYMANAGMLPSGARQRAQSTAGASGATGAQYLDRARPGAVSSWPLVVGVPIALAVYSIFRFAATPLQIAIKSFVDQVNLQDFHKR